MMAEGTAVAMEAAEEPTNGGGDNVMLDGTLTKVWPIYKLHEIIHTFTLSRIDLAQFPYLPKIWHLDLRAKTAVTGEAGLRFALAVTSNRFNIIISIFHVFPDIFSYQALCDHLYYHSMSESTRPNFEQNAIQAILPN